ncbi:unnamed protein product, partial [Mesorhabditis belari]|uniref:Carboxylic ester hydrolase n=1 Tax=Mesorhabditis belari TaxID=2138241 RepID=A0AAF3FSZ8_9BILA
MGAGGSLVSRRELLPAPEVITLKGPVQGRRLQFKDGPTADIFLGIPYAKPPIGALRFKRPEPPDAWTRVLPCRSFRRRSIQVTPSWEPLVARLPACSEDCLYLNVFAPKIEEGKKYPVFFFIHGGGLLMECPHRIQPEGVSRQLVAQGIVVVTMAYRLGFLGFFSTGDDACPGNMGHLDQVEALKWTAANIDRFGGDPKRITIGGQSAGASSADLLCLSPLTRDLIHQKVLLGGGSFGFWASSRLKNTVPYCRDKAKELGWKPEKSYSSTLEENKAMLEFLRTIPAKRFGCTFYGYKPLFKEVRLPLTAVLDGYFLPKPIPKLREDAPDLPVICGVGEYEGLLFVGISTIGTSKKSLRVLLQSYARDEKHLQEGIEEIIDIYKKDGIPPKLNRLFPVVFSDAASNFGLHLSMDYYRTRPTPCYSYIWEYTAKRRYGVLGIRFPFHGATHASELPYLLRQDAFYSNSPYSKKEKILCHVTSDYFSSFIKYGNPNKHGHELHPHWPSITEEKEMQMICMKPNPTLRTAGNFFGKRKEHIWPHIKVFWNDDGLVLEETKSEAVQEVNNNDEKEAVVEEPDDNDEKEVELEMAKALPKVIPPKGHSTLPAVE